MCKHRTVHTSAHACTHPQMCTSGTPTPRKEQKYIDGYTQAHPPPDGHTDISTPAVYLHVHPLLTMHSKSHAPRCAHPRRPAAAKENRKLPQAGAREERGAERQGGGAAASGDPRPPARPPSALTVDARLVRHGSVPRSARALGALSSALDPLRSPGPGGGGGCGGDRPASRSFPGGAAGPGPARPAPDGRGREGAGSRGRACAHRAPCSGWAYRRELIGVSARLRVPVCGGEQGVRVVERAWAHAGVCVCAP